MWPLKKKIGKREALRNLEYQDKKLRLIYKRLCIKAENATKMAKPLEGKVYTRAATNVAKARTLILHKICELKSGIIEGDVAKAVIDAANAIRMVGHAVSDAKDKELQTALEEIQFDIDIRSISEEMLDDALYESGFKPEEIRSLVESEVNMRLMEEITPAEAADRLRLKIEQELSEA